MRSCFSFLALALIGARAAIAAAPEPGLLFYLSGDHGAVADFSAAGTPKPTYEFEVTPVADGARHGALACGNYQLLAYRAPGNVYAQRGTLSFYWRSRYPVGSTAFPIFRVGYADHSSWDMVFLRLDYNGHGFDAFVTDANLARTRVSVPLAKFPEPKAWTHLAVAWDENVGLRFYINGKLEGHVERKARYDLALDQFGPHSRIISPHQVQSDYNFVRGGDIDEVRIYDHMLGDTDVATLADPASAGQSEQGGLKLTPPPPPTRTLANPAVRDEWAFRYGWSREAPPLLPDAKDVAVRKVEIHDAYDLQRWWWKANDGIVETTWPGVYNRSRLPGRNDYFQLPDWDCYVDSGKAVTFVLPEEPWNHLEITGAAWGRMSLLPNGTPAETAYRATAEATLFVRDQGLEKTVHRLTTEHVGRMIRFESAEQEQPMAELGVYRVIAGTAPAGSHRIRLQLVPGSDHVGTAEFANLEHYIDGRFMADERSRMVAQPANQPLPAAAAPAPAMPLVHILVPDTWDELPDGLDGLTLDLPAFAPGAGDNGPVSLNIQVKAPLWPGRNLLDFTFSVPPGEAKTLWLDVRDRLLPKGAPLWLTIASSKAEFNAAVLAGANLCLVFKPRAAALAEHEADRFTQVRDVYAMMTEEHPHDVRLDLWNRFKADLDDLLRANPEHVLGRQYAAVNADAPRPAFQQPEPPAGVPLWAFRQVTLLGQVKHFVEWYIDHRQVEYGDFGGGISDDVDLVNTWPGVALMGADPEKLRASDAALLNAAYRNGMFTNGLPTIQADELHSYEEGINCLAQNLIIDFGSPRQLERAMVTARGVEWLTGVNAAGHRHIRSSYYNGTKAATEDPWGYAKPYSYLVLQVPQLLVDFNGNPTARKYLVELADGLLPHYHPNGRAYGAAIPAVHFVDDAEADVGRGSFPWHVFWAAYKFTGDRKYLPPIVNAGMTSLVTLNPNVLDLLNLRQDWGARFRSGERAVAIEGRRDANRTRERTSGYRASNSDHFAWQLTGDKARLESLYAKQIEECALLDYINTDGSLWIDRVGVPYSDLQRARLGGVALVRGSVFPGHVVSWSFAAPATEQSVAILVPNSTATAMKVIAYNLESVPVRATMTGWNVDPGTWEISQGIDTNGDDAADGPIETRTAPFERSRSVDVTLPPRATTVLTLALKTPGVPYWNRPDLGIDPDDVTVQGQAVHVRVHSLGSVNAPATTVVIRNAAGQPIATAAVPALAAPLDLTPKTVEVTVDVPPGTSLEHVSVEIDPDHQLEEITRLNNTVRAR